MRMLALPAAFALAFALYLPLPRTYDAIRAALARLYTRALSLFTDKRGRASDTPALACFLLALGGVAALLGAIHPAVSALTMAPLFGAISLVPGAASVKRELDGGSLQGDIDAYETLVRDTCRDFAPSFVADACLPLMLCALGTPLYLGGALGWMALALRAAPQSAVARRILPPLERVSGGILHALMLLCSCLVGRSPFRTRGATLSERLLSILGIAQGDASGHAPVAGDIAQAAFLCCFCAGLLCAVLSLALLAFA